MYSDSTPLFASGHLGYLYFSFQGRINRRRYLIACISMGVVAIIATGLLTLAMADDGDISLDTFTFAANVVSLVLLYPSLALMAKRCHDLDRSGHFLWLIVIPLINLWPTLTLIFARGTESENRFGPDPLA